MMTEKENLKKLNYSDQNKHFNSTPYNHLANSLIKHFLLFWLTLLNLYPLLI